MGKTIYKYQVDINDTICVEMPVGAKLIKVGVQSPRKICFWAEVDPSGPISKYYFYIRGTGHPLGDASSQYHVDTVFDGPFVWHIFKAEGIEK